METDRETLLLKQLIIGYSRNVYADWHLKPQHKQMIKCLILNKTTISLTLDGYELMIADLVRYLKVHFQRAFVE